MLWHIFKKLATLIVVVMANPLLASQGVTVVEGDILVEAVAAHSVSNGPTGRAIGVASKSHLWPAGIIPYTIDPTLPAASVTAINVAIEHWNTVGGISLLPLSVALERLPDAVDDSVHFLAGDFCASWVGRRGGQQNVWVAPYCPAGSVMHEIGHVLGLEHEHTRPDRDQYIDIHWENIESDKRHNFDAAPAGARTLGAYDHDSIMHYGTHNFSSDGQPTISAIDGGSHQMGQRVAPSAGDLNAVASLYGSDLSLVVQTGPTAVGSEIDIYVSNQYAQGAHDVSVNVGVAAEFVSVLPAQGWACGESTGGSLTCTLGLLQGSAITRLNISVPDRISAAGIEVSLTSKTPDYDLSNNVSRVLSDDVSTIPEKHPDSSPFSPLEDKPQVQDDMLPEVVAASGGIASLQGLAVMLLLVVGKARGRINRQFFSKHRRHLFSR